MTTANPPPDEATCPIPDVKLGSRLYLAIRYVAQRTSPIEVADRLLYRPAGPSATETGRQGQERTVREVWRRVRNLDYSRPGA
jgi:myo-inositol-1(or 4)-monophosphatase